MSRHDTRLSQPQQFLPPPHLLPPWRGFIPNGSRSFCVLAASLRMKFQYQIRTIRHKYVLGCGEGRRRTSMVCHSFTKACWGFPSKFSIFLLSDIRRFVPRPARNGDLRVERRGNAWEGHFHVRRFTTRKHLLPVAALHSSVNLWMIAEDLCLHDGCRPRGLLRQL